MDLSRSATRSTSSISRPRAWGLAPALALSSVLAFAAIVAATRPATADEPDAPPQGAGESDSQAVVTAVEQLLDLAEAYGEAVPASLYSAAALAAELDGVDAAFAFVRDQTALVPYQGLLKGADGVLQDGDGNSLDRSLLLARLLAERGHEVRLARATLGEAEALELRALSRAVRFDPADGPAPAEPADPRAAVAGVLSERRVEEVIVRNEEQVERAYDRSDVASGSLVAQLREVADASAEERAGLEQAAHVAALRDHWWVQVRADDAWRDLDPTLATPGESRSAVFETVALDAVPEADTHRVTIEVVLESTDTEGASTREVVFTDTRAAAALHAHSILLMFEPLDGPRVDELAALSDDVDAAIARLVATRDWVPHLAVGGLDVYDQLFSMQGETVPASLEAVEAAQLGRGLERAVDDTVGSASDLLGGMGVDSGTGAGAHAAGRREVTGVWLRVTQLRPGASAVTHWRTVYDHYGRTPSLEPAPAPHAPVFDAVERERRTLALLRETRLFVEAARLSQARVQHILGARLATARPALVAMAGGPMPNNEELARATDAANRLDTDLLSLVLGRWRLNPGSDLVFLDRPSLFLAARWERIERDPDGARTTTPVHALDILENHVGVRPLPGLDAFDVRVAQGVADTAAEAAAVGEGAVVVNAARRYVEDLDAGDVWQLVRAPEDPVIAGAPPPVAAMLSADLAGGAVLVAPAPGAARGVWWRVDPVTGTTLGMGADGSGQAQAEYSTVMLQVAVSAVCVGVFVIRLIKNTGINFGITMICLIGSGIGVVGAATGVVWAGNLGGAIGLLATLLDEVVDHDRPRGP